MGRFYQTAKPRFTDNNIYQAPWQLMSSVIQANDQRTDNLLSKTEILEGVVDNIQHLNYEGENNRVKKIQDKYRTKIDELTNKVYENPTEYRKNLPAIKKLQRDMLQDKTSGDWYNIEQRHSGYKNWLKENEKLKETNPTLFNQLNNHWFNDVVNKSNNDPNAKFSGQKIIDRPDLSDEKTRKIFENIKANYNEYLTPDGTYKIGDKTLTEEEVAQVAMAELFSDPSYAGYANQMGNLLGQKGFYDENGKSLPLFIAGENGKNRLNFDHAFANDILSVAKTYGFNEHTVEADKYGLQRNKAGIDARLNSQKHSQSMQQIGARGQVQKELELLRQQGRQDLLIKKYELQGEQDKIDYKNDLILKAASGDKGAEKMINQITAKETIGILGNPTATLEGDYELIENNRERRKDIPNDGRMYFTATPGTAEYAAQQRNKNASDFAINKMKNSKIKLVNGGSFTPEQYISWLGNRRHSEETAKEFLEKEREIYQSVYTSKGEEHMNNARWSPSWLKDDAAEDWDKVYEAGNKYEEYREGWYKKYSTDTQQISLQPIQDTDVSLNMLAEIKSNKENYFVTNAEGETPKNMRSIIDKIDNTSTVYVTAANAHNEMGIKVDIDGEEYFVFPNLGNTAETNVITNLSMMGVDKDSQYFKEMSDRVASNLTHDLSRTGLNSKGTKSIVTKINGIDVSLELVGNQVLLREPTQGLNTEPVRTFETVSSAVNFIYSK